MNINDYINDAVTKVKNATTPVRGGGGGDYSPPPAGRAMLRFVGYVELGKQREEFKGEVKLKDKVKLIFELHGKNYPAKDIEGQMVPQRITITESNSYHEKSNFYKLFTMMRDGDESIIHMSQMLGKAFIGKVSHKSFTGSDGKEKVFARLRDDSGYNIGPPRIEDPVSGDVVEVPVPEAITSIKVFFFSSPNIAMWDNLFIDGTFGDGRTRNVFQEEIKKAVNYQGSKLQQMLESNSLDTELTNQVKTVSAARSSVLGRASDGPDEDEIPY